MDRNQIANRRGQNRVDKYGHPIAESYVPSMRETVRLPTESALVDAYGRPLPGKVDSYGRAIERPLQQGLGVPMPSALDASQVDIKELLKTQIGTPQNAAYNNTSGNQTSTVGSPAISGSGNVTMQTNSPTYGFEDWGFLLDSTNRDITSNYNVGQIQWTLTESNGGHPVANVVEIEISKIQFPRLYLPGANPAVDPDIFYCNRVYVEIVNTPNTSGFIVSKSGSRYHFECEIDQFNAQSVLLVPMGGKYYFRAPIDSMSALQLRFWIPSMVPGSKGVMRPLTLINDNVYARLIPGTNPARFVVVSPGDTTSVFGNIGALTPGVAIFMNSANTGVAAIDSAINSNIGTYATTVVDSQTFEVGAIDASLAAISGPDVAIFIPKNRIATSARIVTVVRSITNYIDVSKP